MLCKYDLSTFENCEKRKFLLTLEIKLLWHHMPLCPLQPNLIRGCVSPFVIQTSHETSLKMAELGTPQIHPSLKAMKNLAKTVRIKFFRIKLLKVKTEILFKAARQMEVILNMVSNWFLVKTIKVGRQWDALFRMWTFKKSCQPRVLYLAKLYFKNEGEIKTFPDKQKLR